MATLPQSQLYPFSTDAGTSIPLDVIWPVSVAITDVAANSVTPLLISPESKVVAFFCDISVIIDFAAVATYPVSGLIETSLFVPANSMITAAVPAQGIVSVIPLFAGESGKIVAQTVVQWVAMGQSRSLVRR